MLRPEDTAAMAALTDPAAAWRIPQDTVDRISAYRQGVRPGARVEFTATDGRIIRGAVLSVRGLEVFVRADDQPDGCHWSVMLGSIRPESHPEPAPARDRIWWPERRTIDGTMVAIGVDGRAACDCGGMSYIDQPDGCRHIAAARDAQQNPADHAIDEALDAFLAAEGWRDDPIRRAELLPRLMQILQAARARRLERDAADARTPGTLDDALAAWGPADTPTPEVTR